MSVIKAIRTVCQRITRRIKVVEYVDAAGNTVLSVHSDYWAKGILWEGAWVELFGANEKKRYQVTKLEPRTGDNLWYIVTLDNTEPLDIGVKQMALLLDFQFGHAQEIQQTLVEQSRDVEWKSKLYPKLVLFLDIEETHAERVSVSLNLAIITTTNKAFKALDREVESFEKVLHPLYRLFMYELDLAPHIDVEYPITHNKTDRYFYGSQPTPDQNVFAALLDAVEITSLSLLIDKELC